MDGGEQNLFGASLCVLNLLNTFQNNPSLDLIFSTCSCLDRKVISSDANYVWTLAPLLSIKAAFAAIVLHRKTCPKSQLIATADAFFLTHCSVGW